MHIFLTGEKQIGKTTLINKILTELTICKLGGFRTISIQDIPETKGSVYLVKADDKNPVCTEENRVGIRSYNQGPIAFPNVFDQYGIQILEDAENSDLILMDEIGKMEREATGFINRVNELLDGDVPILGVVRKEGKTPLQERIRNHPNVKIIEVTLENRDTLFTKLFEIISKPDSRES